MDDVNESLYMPHRPTERRDEWQGPMWNDCGGCNFIRRVAGVDPEMDPNRRYCAPCIRLATPRLDSLAHNLAIAAGLCRAFELGEKREWAVRLGRGARPFREQRCGAWKPGCGRTAP